MPRFAANLSLLFTDRPFLDRFEAAARAGFDAVECQFPYEWPVEVLAERLHAHGLSMVLHNLPAGDWSAGDRGIACHPDRMDEFQRGVGLALHYARVLEVPRLNCLAGIAPPGVPSDLVRATFVANLRFAAQALAAQGITLLTEPINTFDIPGFFLHRTDQALEILAEVDAPNLKLQYDIYHAQRMEGELAGTLRRCLPHIGHIQLADNPGRHEPGTGEIHFDFLLRRLDDLGYGGHVGCEYRPAHEGPGGTEAGLGWISRFK